MPFRAGYQRIYADKQAGDVAASVISSAGSAIAERIGAAPNHHSIDDCPVFIDECQRIDDYEADTVIGKNHQQAIVNKDGA